MTGRWLNTKLSYLIVLKMNYAKSSPPEPVGEDFAVFEKNLFSLLTFIKNDDIIIFEKGREKSGTDKSAFKSREN